MNNDFLLIETAHPTDEDKIVFEKKSGAHSFAESSTPVTIRLYNPSKCRFFYRIRLLKEENYCVIPLNYGCIEPGQKHPIQSIPILFFVC